MRILLLTDRHSVHSQRWLDGLRRRGHVVRVLARQAAADPDVVGPPAWIARIVLLRKAWLFIALLRLTCGFQPQIIHQHWFEVRPFMRLFLGRTPFIISVWGSDILLAQWDESELARARAYARMAGAVTASSRCLAEATERLLQVTPRLIYWGVDLRVLTPRPRAEGGPFTVIFLKHLAPVYGPDLAIRAFARLREAVPDARLRLYGSGEMEAKLRRLAGELGISASVQFMGAIPHAEIAEALAESDVMIMPSRSESFGLAAVEAQAMAVPVVATRVGGILEAVADGVGGLLAPAEDVEALAGHLRRLAADADLRHAMGRNGRRYVEEHFDWERTLDQMEALYAELSEFPVS